MTKKQMDSQLGKGQWRALRRRGIWQGHVRTDGSKKIRGIDNARTSLHNAAAFLTETIAMTPPDIALQICAWLAHCGVPHEELQKLIAGVGSDDLQDAYHSVPNASSELNFCVVAFRDTT